MQRYVGIQLQAPPPAVRPESLDRQVMASFLKCCWKLQESPDQLLLAQAPSPGTLRAPKQVHGSAQDLKTSREPAAAAGKKQQARFADLL